MNQLIKITEQDGNQVVSARELHSALNVSERFQSWFNRQLQYGFEEDRDYVGCKTFNTLANQHLQDYALTTDTAKEISMLQRSEEGRNIRKYLIECEKALRESSAPKQITLKESLILNLDLLNKNELLLAENTKLRPRSEFVDLVFKSDDLITMGQVAKILNLPVGRNNLFKTLREKGVLFKTTNEPRQEFIDRGYFKIKEKKWRNGAGNEKISMQTLVTQKGLGYIAKTMGVIQAPVQKIQFTNQ